MNALAIRNKLNLNQSDFWGAIGVKQSAGSRYENGAEMPIATKALLHLHYIDKAQAVDVPKLLKKLSK